MKLRLLTSLVAVLFATLQTTFAQGTFQNLDSEQATVPPTPVGGYGSFVDPAAAFPGWTVGGFTNFPTPIGTVVGYNTVSLGAPYVILIGPDFPNGTGYSAIQGSYSVEMGYFSGLGVPPTLSQTGLVPADANSISLAGYVSNLTLNGVNVPLFATQGGRLEGDVSSFAGHTAQLTFSVLGYFDDIQFSASAIPEPGVPAIAGLGAVLLSLRLTEWFNNSMKANRRFNFALIACREFRRVVHAMRLFSAAVAYFCRWAELHI
jgi:hypothetical protein